MLHANPGRGQLDQFDFFLRPFKRGIEICTQEGFTHFLVKKISYEDERGQSLEFKGISDVEGGALFSEIITEKFAPPVGTLTLKCEFLFFKNNPLAIEGSRYQLYSPMTVQNFLVSQNKANSAQKHQPWENLREMVEAADFTEDREVLDQLTQFVSVLLLPFRTVLPRSLMYNSKYFLIKSISFKDNQGQSLLFKGVSDVKGGILISDNQLEEHDSPVGPINVESEIYFFEELPDEPLVIDLWEWLEKKENSQSKQKFK